MITKMRNYYPHLSVIAALLVANIFYQPKPANTLYDDQMNEALRDYQIEILPNGDAVIFDHAREVGVIKYSKSCDYSKIFINDNL